MSDTRCRWVASDQPRVVVGRHEDGCEDETCRGCQACTERHCRVCGIEHSDGACAGCVGAVREDLAAIVEMCGNLPEEVEHRGVESEALNLLGPVADPEARGHLEASVRAGRVPPEYLEAGTETPLWTVGTWAMVYRDAFEHDEPVGVVELANEVGYLSRNLTEAGNWPHVPFEDFARDLRRCASHLERVLHDGEQVDEGVPCLTCGRSLKRTWGRTEAEDGWECQRCREKSTEAQYRFAVKADYIAAAEWLTDVDMATRTGVKAGTVRQWALRGQVSKRMDTERIVYSVLEVETRRDTTTVEVVPYPPAAV